MEINPDSSYQTRRFRNTLKSCKYYLCAPNTRSTSLDNIISHMFSKSPTWLRTMCAKSRLPPEQLRENDRYANSYNRASDSLQHGGYNSAWAPKRIIGMRIVLHGRTKCSFLKAGLLLSQLHALFNNKQQQCNDADACGRS